MVLSHQGQHFCVHLRLNPVVAVYESDILSGYRIKSGVPGAAQAPIFLVNHPDTGVFFRVFLADFPGIIGGAVIHQKNFQIFIGLGQDGIYTPGKISRHVVYRYDDTDQGLHGYHSFPDSSR